MQHHFLLLTGFRSLRFGAFRREKETEAALGTGQK
jgi:hypothetical protein